MTGARPDGPRPRFQVDGVDLSELPVLEALAEGPLWNGWRTPIVTAAQFQAFVAAWRLLDPTGAWGPVTVDGDDLVCESPENPADEWDRWPAYGRHGDAVTYLVDGWVWVPAKEPETAECGFCHETKPVAEWCFGGDDEDGSYAVCRECQTAEGDN